MGVTNLCTLINPYVRLKKTPDPFDALLVDMQSFLYRGIGHSMEPEEHHLFQDICDSVWRHLEKMLLKWKPRNVILSFDGEGVPMKWPTQRERRNQRSNSRKTFYNYVLFGNNRLSLKVQQSLKARFRKEQDILAPVQIHITGCDVAGEGEHKMFQLAEILGYRRPLVVSVDQDVFVLALLRLEHYDSIQIFRYNCIYNINEIAFPYPNERFVVVSILFGNDFIHPIVGISPTNLADIHQALDFKEAGVHTPPSILNLFLQRIEPHLKFELVPHVEPKLMHSFWHTYLWILDYYRFRSFPQFYMENRLVFDRNQLLTGLLNEEVALQTFQCASHQYRTLETHRPTASPEEQVFTDQEDLLARLRPYWLPTPERQVCTEIVIERKNRSI